MCSKDKKIASVEDIKLLDFEKVGGLVPAIIQDIYTGKVLMLGYVNSESLEKTLETGFATFFSRSKKRLWKKGESSGNTMSVKNMFFDCDKDTVLMLCEAAGPTCHEGTESCFGDSSKSSPALFNLNSVVSDRFENPKEGSYTTNLFEKGTLKIAQKVGEEGVEVALAAAAQDKSDLLYEAADLMYHLMVCLKSKGLDLKDVSRELEKRFSK